jgi:serine/threonine-protein kinase
VLFSSDGTARISDFGTALPDPAYTSPEQASGKLEIGAASDVFALGTLLYQLLTGLLPFRGEMSAEVMKQITSVDPVVPSRLQPSIPQKLETICLRCLRKSPEERYPSALELAQDLRAFRGNAGWLSGLLSWWKPRNTRG